MSYPSVSIVMPVKNESRYLPSALRSLFRQSLESWELVAVDDFSTDGTEQILLDAARTDPRVRLVRPPRTGLVNALNTGLDLCKAPLVARMDGDDISHPHRLEAQKELMDSEHDIGLVACGFRNFPRHHVRRGMDDYEKWQNRLVKHEEIIREIFVESPFVHPSVMFRRDIVIAIDGYREMGWAEDYDLWLRMAEIGTRFAKIPRPLFFWRERPERATRNMAEYTADAFRRCKVHHLRRGLLRGSEGVILAGAGIEGRKWRRALAAEGIAVSLWVDVDPRKIGRFLHGCPVVGPGDIAPGGQKMLITVGTRGAREGVRKWAVASGFREGIDFLCVS